ncbi:MAG: minichromosome maintenance protein MCM [Nanoarchaeota archaeon]|nr:minichromosome maintenance protein MCM [Nanoarchaeota archaeon]
MTQIKRVKLNEYANLIEEFLRKSYVKKDVLRVTSEGKQSIIIDFFVLDKFSPELADFVLSQPKQALKSFKNGISSVDLTDSKLNVRFTNIPHSSFIKIRDIRSEHLGSLIAIEGQIRTCSDIRPVAKEIVYSCSACANEIRVKQDQMKQEKPEQCPGCARKTSFKILRQVLIDTAHITIEESPETLEGGDQPKRLKSFIEDDLVSPKRERDFIPGNKARLIGILKEFPVILRMGGQSTRYDLILEVNNVEPIEREFEALDISDEDEVKILELAKDKKIYDRIFSSIAPTVLGYDEIKQSIALQIFGGVRKVKSDETAVRGDVHILLIGDPGVGKSMMLTYVNKLAPKSVYVTGKGTSAAGLTATVTRDEITKDWILEAGALVLANKGIAIIDELDKMGHEDRVSMHEAMAQQTVTINKANIHATLNARAGVLAAANPKLGRFDPYNVIHEQINLPPTLINRFDLIFPIRDIPDVKKDEMIARHILETHTSPQAQLDVIDKKLLRKYIAYAKQNANPQLTSAANNEIMKFYVKLRNKKSLEPEKLRPIPISARQLESLIRLAEASARIRLSNKVTKNDALRAIELLRFSMSQVGMDPETGEFDIDRLITGISSTQRNKLITMQNILKQLEEEIGENIPVDSIIQAAQSQGIDEAKANELLSKMAREGDVYSPRHGVVKRMK